MIIILFCLIFLLSTEPSFAALSSPKIAKNLLQSAAKRSFSIPRHFHFTSLPALSEPFPTKISNNPTFPLKFLNYHQILNDKVSVSKLIRGPIPLHLLNDPKFFYEAVISGHHALCYNLVKSGQRVALINDNGDNLISRLVEKDMSHVIGQFIETRTDEALKAIETVDSITGCTPFILAAKQGRRMCIYEMTTIPPQRIANDPVTVQVTKSEPETPFFHGRSGGNGMF